MIKVPYPNLADFYHAETAHIESALPWDCLGPEERNLWRCRWMKINRSPAKPHVPFEGGGVRESQAGRPRFELLVPLGVPYSDQFLTRCAVHVAKGVEKYADRNWESWSDQEALERTKASALRHLFQWLTDEDDGEDHAAAVVFNLMAAENVRRKLAKESGEAA